MNEIIKVNYDSERPTVIERNETNEEENKN